MAVPDLYSFERAELVQAITDLGQPVFRANQLWDGLYRQLYADFDEFSTLNKPLCHELAQAFTIGNLKPLQAQQSQDGETRKTLFQTDDRQHIETVLMHYDERESVCVSSQAGCAMRCLFCATGQMGFKRNLTTAEIVAQVVDAARQLKPAGRQVTNVIVMGMGEPMNNYDSTLKAIRILNDPQGLMLGARRFTLSTVGIVPGIDRLAAEHMQVNLAISLHAAEDGLRSQLLPVNDTYPIGALMAACDRYTAVTNRRVTYEYALIAGVNDSVAAARTLARLLRGRLAHVNLIRLNPTAGYGAQPTTQQGAAAFLETLRSDKVPATLRLSRGADIDAGCGQLSARYQNPIKPF